MYSTNFVKIHQCFISHITALTRCDLLLQTVVWSICLCLSVCLSVCKDCEPCKSGWTDQDAISIVDSGWPKELCPDHCTGRGTFEGMMLGFSACCRALFSMAQMLGFPHMLSISIPVGWSQKQLSITKNPAPCDAACHHNSWTTCVVLLTNTQTRVENLTPSSCGWDRN